MPGDESGGKGPRRTVSFEVAVRRQRRWEVHATYSLSERETALEDARALEKETMVDGTKVTKETWHHDTNRIDTAVIYRSRALEEEMIEVAAARPKPEPEKPAGFGARLAARVTGALNSESSGGTASTPVLSSDYVVADVSMANVLPWILISFIGACIAGGGATVLASMAMQAVIADGIRMSRQEQSGALLTIFLAATGLVFFIALRRILAKFARDRRLQNQAAAKARRSAAGPATAATSSAATVAAVDALAAEEAGNGGKSGGDGSIPVAPDDVLEAARNVLPVGEQIKAFEAVLRDRLRERLYMFDASQRFALNIYIAGVVERLAQSADAGVAERKKLLTAPLIRLGTAPDIAARFGQSLDEHLTRPRALDVFNRGREAAARFADGDADAIDPISAIAAWDSPVAEGGEPESDIVAIMFTDIVESTARTHAMGDQAGQVIVRAHNAIVRDVLKRCDGTEIKHTGDGIMSSFAIASHAVEAARLILRNTEAFSAADDSSAFELRIGINVGEPVRENDDLFGTAVQLAARLCGVGEAGQTIVSRVVRDLCTGKDYVFDSLGSIELKGIPGDTELYALRWRDSDTAAPALSTVAAE